ncbi:MAG: hypothetical protein JEZ07_18785 [Phycisphaerae bacterium]|nr:hypothetical protein [Phycisphaerae bacterium]
MMAICKIYILLCICVILTGCQPQKEIEISRQEFFDLAKKEILNHRFFPNGIDTYYDEGNILWEKNCAVPLCQKTSVNDMVNLGYLRDYNFQAIRCDSRLLNKVYKSFEHKPIIPQQSRWVLLDKKTGETIGVFFAKKRIYPSITEDEKQLLLEWLKDLAVHK